MGAAQHILLTGATGLVGTHLRQHWGDRYQLRLADVRPIEQLAPHETFTQLDITQLDAFVTAAEGIDTIVHLAADPSMEAEFFSSLLDRNVIGTYHAFEAARRAGCRRIVFASSINVVFATRGQEEVRCDLAPCPTNVYGATKVWGEALAHVYAERHGLSCLCVRIGGGRFRQDGNWDPDRPNGGISGRDQAQLFACCIDAPDSIRFKVVNGTSRHRRSWLSLTEARELGYEPEDGTAFPRPPPAPAD